MGEDLLMVIIMIFIYLFALFGSLLILAAFYFWLMSDVIERKIKKRQNP